MEKSKPGPSSGLKCRKSLWENLEVMLRYFRSAMAGYFCMKLNLLFILNKSQRLIITWLVELFSLPWYIMNIWAKVIYNYTFNIDCFWSIASVQLYFVSKLQQIKTCQKRKNKSGTLFSESISAFIFQQFICSHSQHQIEILDCKLFRGRFL